MISAEQFEAAVGHAPEQDDLERCNCPKQGQPGHWQCGWDNTRNMPRFMFTFQEMNNGTPSN